MVSKYYPIREINTKLFEKDYIDMIEFFSSAPLPPVNVKIGDTSDLLMQM